MNIRSLVLIVRNKIKVSDTIWSVVSAGERCLLYLGVFFVCVVPQALAGETALPLPLNPAEPPGRSALNPELFVTATHVRAQSATHKKLLLIDVRHHSAFEKFRIPGSINIPIFAVKTKTMFKSNPLVLFNSGGRNTALAKACMALRNKGFDVSVMFGGLAAWRSIQGPIQGDFFAQKALNTMGASEWFGEKDYSHWIVVNAADVVSDQAKHLVPNARHVPWTDGPEQFRHRLSKIFKAEKTTPLLSLLVLNETGQGYDGMEKALAGMGPVFFLKDGLDGYSVFLKQQALIREQDTSKTISTRKCKTCS